MKKLLTFILIFLCSSAFCADIAFAPGKIDGSKLPNASTSVLMHFDGDLLDIGGSTWTNTSFDGFSTTAKYGQSATKNLTSITTSYFIDSFTATDSFDFGTEDFTVEYWLGFDLATATSAIQSTIASLYLRNTGAVYYSFQAFLSPELNEEYVISIRFSDYFGDTIAGTTLPKTTGLSWTHLCFERRSGTLYLYINGVLAASGAFIRDVSAYPIYKCSLSVFSRTDINGSIYIDELQVTKNGYKYGGAFTPSSRQSGLASGNSINISTGKLSF